MLTRLKFLIAAFALPIVALRSMIAAHGSPQEVADKWLRGLQNAQQDMEAGVMRVQVAPGATAAQKKQKFVQAITDPHMHDKWANNVAAVTLQQWQQAMKNYGVSRVAQGAQAKVGKFVAAMGPLLQYIDNVSAQVRAMPDTTYADREQRMISQARLMRNYTKPAGS